MAVALTERIILLCKTESRASRRHDHRRQRQTLSALLQRPVGRIAIIGTVTEKPIDPTLYLVQKLGQYRDVADIVIRKVKGRDLVIIPINADMEVCCAACRHRAARTDKGR